MGEAEQIDRGRWNELFDPLLEEDRGELIHMAEHLARKAAREGLMASEDRVWLDAAAGRVTSTEQMCTEIGL
jgi:hypothetical protein